MSRFGNDKPEKNPPRPSDEAIARVVKAISTASRGVSNAK